MRSDRLARRRHALAGILLTAVVPGCGHPDAQDEAMSGMTMRETPVVKRGTECFPAETRDLLWEMDQVATGTGPDRALKPLNFDENRNGKVDVEADPLSKRIERNSIRGRNTWLVWGGGNEAFWGWLQEQGYGITDFLILLDSRERDTRFARTGLINQPGFKSSTTPFLGLYLDQEESSGSTMLHPPGPAQYAYPAKPESCSNKDGFFFTPWTTAGDRAREWEKLRKKPEDEDPFASYVPEVVRNHLERDGFDPAVYGYPSGIFGLRLFLNPDFFANTEAADRARSYWRERVEMTNGRYYIDPQLNADPDLVRPFRVSMSCGFCHIGPHPLNPPLDFEHPKWENLSGIIGGQYWNPQPSLGNLLARKDFLHHFLRSQAPGTVDTSLISTDQINNTNVINAVFDVPARLTRAANKPTETQSQANLLLPGIEDPGRKDDQRHFPMVLFPGEDSVGVFGALARVYLNIGLFSEQWNRVDNPVIGFSPQRPFKVATSDANSVYWQVNRDQRVPYLASFFTVGGDHGDGIPRSERVPKSTQPMWLKDVAGRKGLDVLAGDTAAARVLGRKVFLENCAICHSSKQPDGFDLTFDLERKTKDWKLAPAPAKGVYTLPADFYDKDSQKKNWDDFKQSEAYKGYVAELTKLASGSPAYDGGIDSVDPFFEDNFLSNELRIPVTLVGTYSGRAMATNAMRGHVWDNFSSETFKNLPSVGKVPYYNPYKKDRPEKDLYGNNDEYSDGREKGGPGYFRPASLLGLWATAPYLHNNALGLYTHDPSLDGRLLAFDDAIRKLLETDRRDPKWRPRPARPDSRFQYDPDCIYRITKDASGDPVCIGRIPKDVERGNPGDLRLDAVSKDGPDYARDPGYIYRLPVDTQFSFAARFIRPLIQGVLTGYLGMPAGRIAFLFLSTGLWVLLAALFALGAWKGRARHVGVLLLLVAVVLASALAVTGIGGSGGTVFGVMMMIGMGIASVLSVPPAWLWAAVIVAGVLGFLLLLARHEWRGPARSVFAALLLASLVGGFLVNNKLHGRSTGFRLGPIPRGTPVNLLMNIDPEKTDKLPAAIVALARALQEIKQRGLIGDEAQQVFSATAAPALMAASKVPDFVLDRGHWFGEHLNADPGENDRQKEALIAFLKTL
ncbi:MAG TPA: hypothetical protein VFY49_06310 [Myxococcota bacterium]|nr:hypothetical protein [Myxococcota bacterium]